MFFFDGCMLKEGAVNNPLWNGKTMEPALNINKTDDNFEIELTAPGIVKKDFILTIEDGCLNITAEKESSEEENYENYTRSECSYNSFERSLHLPESVKEEEIKAKYSSGVLSFKFSKKGVSKKRPPKVIEVSQCFFKRFSIFKMPFNYGPNVSD